MKGLGEDGNNGLVLSTHQVPLPRSKREIVNVIHAILDQKRIQSIVVELGKPITYTKLVEEAEGANIGVTDIGSIVRNVPMKEVVVEAGGYAGGENRAYVNRRSAVVEALIELSARKLFLTHIGVGVNSTFLNWVSGEKIYRPMRSFAGALILAHEEIPDDVVVFCGGGKQGGDLDDVEYAVKILMWESAT